MFTNLDAPKHARTRFFEPATDDWAISHGLLWRLQSQHGVGVPVKFSKTRAYVAVDEDAEGKPVFETWRISGLKYWNENPVRAATLVAKRSGNPGARNLAAPRKKPRENWPRFVVEEKEGIGPWMPRASFRILEDAEKLARDIHRAQPTIAVRVIDTKS